MNTFSEGDLIEATKGEQVVRGRVIRPGTTDRLALSVFEATPDRAPFIQWLDTHGWTFRTIEKAAPALPTEPGVYITKYGKVWELSTNRVWWFKGKTYSIVTVRDYAPFTRLEPVAVSAKKVLETLIEFWAFGAPPGVNAAIVATGEQFGVTS